MNNRTTLLSLFEKGEDKLRRELSKISIPQDEEKLISIVNNFFVSDVAVTEYKKELTIHEVVMLNSILQLIDSQSKLANSIIGNHFVHRISKGESDELNDFNNSFPTIAKVSGASFVGGITGGLLFGMNWGCVLVSVAGCALGMYLVGKEQRRSDTLKLQPAKLDVDFYINICKVICQSIDTIINDYSSNIAKIRESYENKPKQTLGSTYKAVLERIGNLLIASIDNPLPEEAKTSLQLLLQTVKNYRCEILLYSDATKEFFDENFSEYVKTPKIVKAAIVEDGQEMERGEILLPK